MKKLIGAGLSFLVCVGAAYAEGPLKSKMVALHVSVDQNGSETLMAQEEVVPGDVLEYKLTYENTGSNALSGLVVSVPVPYATRYVSESAKTSTPGTFEVSIDQGLTWQSPPVYRSTLSGDELVPASEYDFVRWLPSTAINSGEKWDFHYRVTVE